MITVSVLYPRNSDSRFDYDYYLQKHMPLVQSRWSATGLVGVNLMRGSATLDGIPCPYELIAILTFNSIENMRAALAAAGNEIMADIPNFTDVRPLVQVNQPLMIP
jgi:uncharacterized protein (TIGR02118 family)